MNTPGESPCAACPWMKKGQPDLKPEHRDAAAAGAWFCCHVHMGTCHGAALYTAAKQRSETTERETTECPL